MEPEFIDEERIPLLERDETTKMTAYMKTHKQKRLSINDDDDMQDRS